jgi:uncharacterized Fe-S cluster protein YjdI
VGPPRRGAKCSVRQASPSSTTVRSAPTSAIARNNLAQVFKLRQEPWIDPAGATPEAIAKVINTCPSGALPYVLTENTPADGTGQEPERPQEIQPLKNGPYAVTGGISIVSPDGRTYEDRDRCALCRCGGSTNKPFCSGAHWNNGFTADGA